MMRRQEESMAKMTLKMEKALAPRDETCEECGARAERLQCAGCGAAGWITNCGHLPQPRPLAVSADGSGDVTCLACERPA